MKNYKPLSKAIFLALPNTVYKEVYERYVNVNHIIKYEEIPIKNDPLGRTRAIRFYLKSGLFTKKMDYLPEHGEHDLILSKLEKLELV